jgi:hypothetical protein
MVTTWCGAVLAARVVVPVCASSARWSVSSAGRSSGGVSAGGEGARGRTRGCAAMRRRLHVRYRIRTVTDAATGPYDDASASASSRDRVWSDSATRTSVSRARAGRASLRRGAEGTAAAICLAGAGRIPCNASPGRRGRRRLRLRRDAALRRRSWCRLALQSLRGSWRLKRFRSNARTSGVRLRVRRNKKGWGGGARRVAIRPSDPRTTTLSGHGGCLRRTSSRSLRGSVSRPSETCCHRGSAPTVGSGPSSSAVRGSPAYVPRGPASPSSWA